MTDILLPPSGLTSPSEFELYDLSLAQVNEKFPQRQGLTADEYDEVVSDPRVISTRVVGTDGSSYLVPQLAPIESYQWLNTEFYSSRYPEQSNSDTIRHFMDIQGVSAQEAVQKELGNLATANGAVIFDFPSVDPDYPRRVEEIITLSGGQVVEAQQLGTQTYYAGRVRKTSGINPDLPSMTTQQGLREMVKKGDIPKDLPADGTTYVETIDTDTANHLFDIYSEAFSVLNDHPCRQGFTPEEFREVMVSKAGKSIGKLLYMAGGEVANMVMFSHSLPFPWLNPSAYKNLMSGKYPIDQNILEEFKDGQIFYFPAIATNPNNRKGLDSQPVIDLLARAVDYSNDEVVVGFDCCDFNKDVLDLPGYIAKLINNTRWASVDGFKEIGQQRYMGYKLAPAN